MSAQLAYVFATSLVMVFIAFACWMTDSPEPLAGVPVLGVMTYLLSRM